MTVYQYKVTAVIDAESVMIINMFTPKDMDNQFEKEEYMYKLLDQGVVPEEITFERLNSFNTNSPFSHAACEGIMYAAEFSN